MVKPNKSNSRSRKKQFQALKDLQFSEEQLPFMRNFISNGG